MIAHLAQHPNPFCPALDRSLAVRKCWLLALMVLMLYYTSIATGLLSTGGDGS